MDPKLTQLLEKQGYRIVGGHSAVKTCHWTKESLLKGRVCYKERFYGISSHRCLQMTPAVGWCQHSCIFCWRPIEHSLGPDMKVDEVDEPGTIIDGAIEKQRLLLSGYGGEERADKERVQEAMNPTNAAISLAGEPTTYPYIDELIREYHKRGFSTFLVTNGQNPDQLEATDPTQLYLSLIAPNPEIYKKTNRPLLKDGWDRLMGSLDIMKDKKGKTAIRITLIRGYNLEVPELFAPLIERAEPDYVEAKGYVHVGFSRKRLEREDMPSYEEIMEFSRVLAEGTGYLVKDSFKDSKVALLSRK